MQTTLIASELAVATGVTTAVSMSVNADPLITALIGFGVSLVTMVGGELVKYLVAFFKAKREKIEGGKKDE